MNAKAIVAYSRVSFVESWIIGWLGIINVITVVFFIQLIEKFGYGLHEKLVHVFLIISHASTATTALPFRVLQTN